VKEQRTYFADVGAFELPEEEVSDSELERELNLIPEYMTFLFFFLYRSSLLESRRSIVRV
jgi:hypothetical protein